jgi:hypothetical protein
VVERGGAPSGKDEYEVLDMEWWRREAPSDWKAHLEVADSESVEMLRSCTYSGRPFGDESFVTELGERFGRH